MLINILRILANSRNWRVECLSWTRGCSTVAPIERSWSHNSLRGPLEKLRNNGAARTRCECFAQQQYHEHANVPTLSRMQRLGRKPWCTEHVEAPCYLQQALSSTCTTDGWLSVAQFRSHTNRRAISLSVYCVEQLVGRGID